MRNKRENQAKNAVLVTAAAPRVESNNATATFTFTGENYRWFYICRRRA